MPRAPRSPRPFVVRRSAMHGKGAFAARPIDDGERIIEYAGERITPDEMHRRYPGDTPHTFCFLSDDDVVVDAGVNGNAARWINHGCDPNCDVVVDQGRLWIEAIRDIAAGEELCYDYALTLAERHTPAAKRRFPCHCGSPRCRGTMLARKR